MTSAEDAPKPYHHGNLRAALIRAGYEIASREGLHAVSLRACTRAVGVSAAAAYRHFESHEDLLIGVSGIGMADLAQSIENRLAHVDADDPRDRARLFLEAVGLGYIDFALDEPGAFEATTFGLLTMGDTELPESAGGSGRTPYQLLTDGIAGLCETGLLSPVRADEASVLCWSGVHGFATLATRGPMRSLPRPQLDAMAAGIVRDLVAALCTPSYENDSPAQ